MKRTNRDTESTVSNNSEEAVATHEPGTYPAIPVRPRIERRANRINCRTLREN